MGDVGKKRGTKAQKRPLQHLRPSVGRGTAGNEGKSPEDPGLAVGVAATGAAHATDYQWFGGDNYFENTSPVVSG